MTPCNIEELLEIKMFIQWHQKNFRVSKIGWQGCRLKMCTLWDLVCMNSSYETKQDRQIGTVMKIFYNVKRIFEL